MTTEGHPWPTKGCALMVKNFNGGKTAIWPYIGLTLTLTLAIWTILCVIRYHSVAHYRARPQGYMFHVLIPKWEENERPEAYKVGYVPCTHHGMSHVHVLCPMYTLCYVPCTSAMSHVHVPYPYVPVHVAYVPVHISTHLAATMLCPMYTTWLQSYVPVQTLCPMYTSSLCPMYIYAWDIALCTWDITKYICTWDISMFFDQKLVE